MKAVTASRREQIRAMLADLKMPGALEAVDGVLSDADGGAVTTSAAIERLLGAQITLRNNRRLQAAMRSSRLPAVKTLDEFDFSFQPSIKREQIDSLHERGHCPDSDKISELQSSRGALRALGQRGVPEQDGLVWPECVGTRSPRISSSLSA